jgi:hypothetical protein
MRFGAATHNIMDGVLWKKLLRHYVDLNVSLSHHPLGILNLQENVQVQPDEPLSTSTSTPSLSSTKRKTTCADLIAQALGSDYQVISMPSKDARLATIYNTKHFQLVGKPHVFKLPRLATLPTWNKIFIKSGQIEQKNALVCDFQCISNETKRDKPASIIRNINFHLDAAGNNQHRTKQMQSLLTAMKMNTGAKNRETDNTTGTEEVKLNDIETKLISSPLHHIISGDTNIFHLSNTQQQVELKNALDCLLPMVSSDDIELTRPTHWFARANENSAIHQLGVFVGNYLGIDRPQAYDVVLTNLKIIKRGQISTDDCSDHDLVYAVVDV